MIIYYGIKDVTRKKKKLYKLIVKEMRLRGRD
jgi:hypothetical protein